MDFNALLSCDWMRLAGELDIPESVISEFPKGEEIVSVFEWLAARNLLHDASAALTRIGRDELADELETALIASTGQPEEGKFTQASLLIDPGSASAEEIAEYLSELSKLYRMMGGSGIRFTQAESRCAEGEFA